MYTPIATERLLLRPVVESDRAAIAAALGDFEVSKWLARVPHPFGLEDVIIDTDGFPGMSAIDLGGEMIGAVRCTEDHLGYWLARDHWGQGYGPEAVEAAVTQLMDVRGGQEIRSGVFDGNRASLRLLERLGFAPTGCSAVFCAARGVELPHTDMVLTRAAWEARR